MEKNNFDDIANELDEKIAIAEEKDVIKQYLNLLEDNDVKEYIELINKRRSINDNIIRFEIKRSTTYKTYVDDAIITNSPFHLGYEEKIDKKSRNGFALVFFISIALALIPSNFITII